MRLSERVGRPLQKLKRTSRKVVSRHPDTICAHHPWGLRRGQEQGRRRAAPLYSIRAARRLFRARIWVRVLTTYFPAILPGQLGRFPTVGLDEGAIRCTRPDQRYQAETLASGVVTARRRANTLRSRRTGGP